MWITVYRESSSIRNYDNHGKPLFIDESMGAYLFCEIVA